MEATAIMNCERCGFSTVDADYWPVHIEAHAQLDAERAKVDAEAAREAARPTFVCDLCGFSTKDADYWPVHLRAHEES